MAAATQFSINEGKKFIFFFFSSLLIFSFAIEKSRVLRQSKMEILDYIIFGIIIAKTGGDPVACPTDQAGFFFKV